MNWYIKEKKEIIRKKTNKTKKQIKKMILLGSALKKIENRK